MNQHPLRQNDRGGAAGVVIAEDSQSTLRVHAAGGLSKHSARNQALDFSKGILVLFMVLYHWVNYFVSTEGFFYRYLRFITPSFILITGFLVTHAYLAKYAVGDLRLTKRLLQRGLKLLALFTGLNLAANLVAPRNYDGAALGFEAFFRNLFSIYVTADSRAAVFQVLVPISYVLMLSGGLLLLRRWLNFSIYHACAGLFAGIFVLDVCGVVVANLELIGIGFLGVYLGSVRIEKISALVRYAPAIVLAYAGYCGAVSIWDVVYPLQVVGVCLSLMLIYLAGMNCRKQGAVLDRVYILGRYSLLAYIAQIVALQLLHKLLRPVSPDGLRLVISLLAALGMTQIAVELVEFGRARSKNVDWLYRLVFA